MANVHRELFIYRWNVLRLKTTCHKCLPKHRSSLQYFRLGCDEYFMLLNLNGKVEHNYTSRHSITHSTSAATSTLHLKSSSYHSAFQWYSLIITSVFQTSLSKVPNYMTEFPFLSDWCIYWTTPPVLPSHRCSTTIFHTDFTSSRTPIYQGQVKPCKSIPVQLFTSQW